ncbi:hypothetical protein TcasGA2_TC031414 [Tribolium castaneum]|uniref:Cytochrome P450 n=1 Tax=Tribolium castaneum TaxID=7070 RepID=A0A139WAP7_TRICA|nr:hypothetical protein TcasGA2_TC031414 [Tribolium castaneum]
MIPIILTITVVTIVYYLLHLNYQYWKKRGIANPKPVFLLGNFGKCFFLRASPGQVYYDVYNKYKNEQVVGLYRATTPVLLVRDPELIKEVMVKSFSSFHNNDVYVYKKRDPIVGRNPFVLKGEEWKSVRQQLTPGFTSGKMKWLYPLLDEVAENLVKFIENQPKTLNAKDVCARFTLNNVASCAFGIEGKCFEEENNHFRQMAIEFLSPSSWSFIGLFLVLLNPSLLKVLPIKFVTKNCEKKLIDLVQQTVKYREDNNVVRNDFLHILTQLKKTSSEFTDIDVVAHAAGFFGDGYETTAGVMSFVLYCLAENLDIQTKLRELVDKVFENNEEKLPYEALQEIHFLDAVVNETLRLHPPALHFQKLCTQDFTFVLKNANKSVTIEKGTPVILPVYGLHHDPDYYESPDLFKPERFLPENKDKTVKCTFMPFGEGPRSCLGQRFGLLQVKVGVAHIIRHFELSVNGKTQRPIKYEPTNPVTAPVGGFWDAILKALVNYHPEKTRYCSRLSTGKMLPIILIVTAVTIICYLIHLNYQYWKKRGVKGPRPHYLVGNIGKVLLLQASPGQVFAEAYNEFKDEDVVGLYRAMSPIILIRDPELVKEVILKSFNSFHDNDMYIDKGTDAIAGRHPFLLRGDDWKITRQKLTPGFTSGKMKWLYPLLEEVSATLIKFIETHPETTNGTGCDIKDLCGRFTLNNVASCAFGIEGKCLEEKNSQFQQLALDFMSPGSTAFFTFFLSTIIPSLSKILKVRFISQDVENRLVDLIGQTVKYRQENNVLRNDFLHILIELTKTHKDYQLIDVTSHAAAFFADGYETSASVMSFVLYELAANPGVQERLREEVGEAFAKNGTLPYDGLQEIHFLDAIVSETLRLHPPLQHLQKVCTKDFTFVAKNTNKTVTIEKGTTTIIPIYGLQHDSKFFENPDSFQPERFLGSNKDSIAKGTFLPYGDGPRACLGIRFGLLQIKVGVAYIIHHYELTVNKKTKVPLKFVATSPVTAPVGGFWLNFRKLK